MAEVPFRPVRQLSEYKGKGASASRERNTQCFDSHLWSAGVFFFCPETLELSAGVYLTIRIINYF